MEKHFITSGLVPILKGFSQKLYGSMDDSDFTIIQLYQDDERVHVLRKSVSNGIPFAIEKIFPPAF